MARRLLGRAFGSDPILHAQLIGKSVSALRPDRVGRTPLDTVLALDELIEVGGPAPAIAAGVDLLLTSVGAPGAFGEGCTAARHAHRLCEHFLGGFFSAAPPTHRVAPLELPNGRVWRVESQARFAASTWMLAAVVRAGRVSDPGVQRHLDSFTHLLDEWARWDEFLAPDLAFGAIGALAAAPERWHPTREALLRLAAQQQAPDGTWPKADFFTALDGLSRTTDPLAIPMLERALPSLLQRQREDGSFGSVAQDERSLIGLRVFQRTGSLEG